MGGHKTDAHEIAHHHRQRLVLLPRIGIRTHRRLHEHIVKPFLQVFLGARHSLAGRRVRLIGRRAELHLHLLVEGGEQVKPSVTCILSLVDNQELRLQAKSLTMITGHLGRAIDDWRAEFEHRRILKCLENHFITNTVRIAMRNCHANLSFFHIISIYSFLSPFHPFTFSPFLAVDRSPQAAKISCPRLARMVVNTPWAVR